VVYIDPLKHYGGKGFFKGKSSSHMWADSLEELHAMADAIGMRRSWFQDDPRLPHYDLVATRRRKAVSLGAIEVTQATLVAILKKSRHEAFLQSISCPSTAKRGHR
jgi:Protein of unknown function (DUF4031)